MTAPYSASRMPRATGANCALNWNIIRSLDFSMNIKGDSKPLSPLSF